MLKKIIASFILILVLVIGLVGIKYSKYNKSYGWTYLKYNDTLYVLNLDSPEDKEEKINNLEFVGVVKKKIPKLFEPIANNSSNGIPKGVKFFKDKNSVDNNIYILVKGKYYPLSNIETAEGWGNGIKANFKELRV